MFTSLNNKEKLKNLMGNTGVGKHTKQPSYSTVGPQQDREYRTRTNSLINSCNQEVNFKMKFIRDMPNNFQT